MKIKILFFLFSLSGGGAERTVINIINNLNKEKYEVLLVLGSHKNNDYIDLLNENIKIKVLGSTKLRYSLFKLRNLIVKEKPDLLFSTINPNNIILLLAKVLAFKRIPTIVREASNRTQSGKVTKLNKLLTYLLYNLLANKIIALSKGVKEDLTKNFSIKESKVEIIYNPVEIEKIELKSEETIKDISRFKNEKLIVTVGRLVEAKDHETLIKAFKIVSKTINAKLIIIGKGELENKLKKLRDALGLSNKVIFLGFKKNPYKYMRAADVFVLSSKWEGFGHVIVEAMVTGTPVISTDCNSGPAEIISNNKNGALVPVGDPEKLSKKIIEVLNNKDLMNKYSRLGKERAMDFQAANITREYEKVFETTVKLAFKIMDK